MSFLLEFAASFWWTLGEMAPYLLLGFAVAGALSVFVKKELIERHLGGRGVASAVKASLLGVPLPLCSCGVIPVAASLRQHGASRGATTSFLISTPQTGVDSILATWGLLGPVLGVVRPIVALVSGIVGGIAVDLAAGRAPSARTVALPMQQPGIAPRRTDACCAPAAGAAPPRGWSRWAAALRYGFVTLPNDILRSLLLGLAVAALVAALVEPGRLAGLLGGPWGYFLMLGIGVPIYVCSTGSIPLALSFMHLGASPGAALVFLITGPATNAATIAVVWNQLGKRTTAIYLATVMLSGLVAGWALDTLARSLTWNLVAHDHVMHQHAMGPMMHLWAALMIAVLATSFVLARWPGPRSRAAGDAAMSDAPSRTRQLKVEGMTCSHCAAAVTRALREQPGVADVAVDLSSGQARVIGDRLEVAGLIKAVEALGYRARPASGSAV